MSERAWPTAQGEEAAWREHSLSQLRYFASLSLRETMQAVEGMADVVRRFREMRDQGKLVSGSVKRR
jgi:hypothetical protein